MDLTLQWCCPGILGDVGARETRRRTAVVSSNCRGAKTPDNIVERRLSVLGRWLGVAAACLVLTGRMHPSQRELWVKRMIRCPNLDSYVHDLVLRSRFRSFVAHQVVAVVDCRKLHRCVIACVLFSGSIPLRAGHGCRSPHIVARVCATCAKSWSGDHFRRKPGPEQRIASLSRPRRKRLHKCAGAHYRDFQLT